MFLTVFLLLALLAFALGVRLVEWINKPKPFMLKRAESTMAFLPVGNGTGLTLAIGRLV